MQFSKPILFRVIRVLDRPTYDGWIWLEGYQIDNRGDAVERRSIFVMKAGLRTAPPSVVNRPMRLKSPARAAPVSPASPVDHEVIGSG